MNTAEPKYPIHSPFPSLLLPYHSNLVLPSPYDLASARVSSGKYRESFLGLRTSAHVGSSVSEIWSKSFNSWPWLLSSSWTDRLLTLMFPCAGAGLLLCSLGGVTCAGCGCGCACACGCGTGIDSHTGAGVLVWRQTSGLRLLDGPKPIVPVIILR